METTPNASVKDLLSTGYFYDELKNYTQSKEIDLFSYSRDYAVPYLIKISEFHAHSGQVSRTEILDFAVDYLSNASDEDLSNCICELKKIIISEIDYNERALHELDRENTLKQRIHRHKSETAQSLAKLLINIIRMFKLQEIITQKTTRLSE